MNRFDVFYKIDELDVYLKTAYRNGRRGKDLSAKDNIYRLSEMATSGKEKLSAENKMEIDRKKEDFKDKEIELETLKSDFQKNFWETRKDSFGVKSIEEAKAITELSKKGYILWAILAAEFAWGIYNAINVLADITSLNIFYAILMALIPVCGTTLALKANEFRQWELIRRFSFCVALASLAALVFFISVERGTVSQELITADNLQLTNGLGSFSLTAFNFALIIFLISLSVTISLFGVKPPLRLQAKELIANYQHIEKKIAELNQFKDEIRKKEQFQKKLEMTGRADIYKKTYLQYREGVFTGIACNLWNNKKTLRSQVDLLWIQNEEKGAA